MSALNLVAAGTGISLAVGGGLFLYGDYLLGSILFVLGLANLVRFVQLWRKVK